MAATDSITAVGCDALSSPPHPEEFRKWLASRVEQGESRSGVGRSLGVTHDAIRLYLNGMRPSDTVLLLAGRLMRERVPNQSPLDAG